MKLRCSNIAHPRPTVVPFAFTGELDACRGTKIRDAVDMLSRDALPTQSLQSGTARCVIRKAPRMQGGACHGVKPHCPLLLSLASLHPSTSWRQNRDKLLQYCSHSISVHTGPICPSRYPGEFFRRSELTVGPSDSWPDALDPVAPFCSAITRELPDVLLANVA
ncbi:hypothetical protein OBBRIDRAFT_17716 [Obba rivulosa]|uniref:Uncharacterized protein n=1 Tax=Obba rivulosa TaxID=1052685 RepID=A0A8E2DVZ6_9APHY|nr:hypothetical protein OBBRIDRAFT_17716 [Obba rivulosa]